MTRGGARPGSGPKPAAGVTRREELRARATEGEKAEIVEAAAAEGRTTSDYLRTAALDRARAVPAATPSLPHPYLMRGAARGYVGSMKHRLDQRTEMLDRHPITHTHAYSQHRTWSTHVFCTICGFAAARDAVVKAGFAHLITE
jgi:hypothetical protein